MENANVAEFTGIDPADLELCFAGMSHCEPSHSYGPAVRPNYLLHIVIQGKGRFIQNEMEFSLHANQGFLIVPDQLTFIKPIKRILGNTCGSVFGEVVPLRFYENLT